MYENIRKIPANLNCGNLLDMKNSIASNLSRDFLYHECEKIMPTVTLVFNKAILKAMDEYLGENNENNLSEDISDKVKEEINAFYAKPENFKINLYKGSPENSDAFFSSTPNIPTIKHDTNQFGHTPKPKTTPKKYKHILFDKPAKDIKTMKNLSRKFGEWVKYKAGDRKGGACNITFYEGNATMELSFNYNFNRIYINFYGIGKGTCDWVPCNRKDKEYYCTKDFWRMYKRRITKTIAQMIREIENNSNNWEYIEDKHE